MSYSLLSPYEDPTFNSGALRPFECLSLGWQLIKDQYFLFLGMFLIIVVLVTPFPPPPPPPAFTSSPYAAPSLQRTTHFP